ncbi:MAG TPA: HAD family phosphatase [Acidimicrobiales bacterium]|nr:HAD family phosphatase [Acidimicrobiales bacterium]
MTWLLCDYGEVLSLPQPLADQEAIESITGQAGGDFWTSYWDSRPAYDRGDVTAQSYWTAVLGACPTPTHLDAIIESDAASWIHPNSPALDAASRASQRGLQLAIFSNAPLEIAAAIDSREWLAEFSPRIFSCNLRTIKPEPAAYLAVLATLNAGPNDVVFFDDRAANVVAARQIGIRAELFTDAQQFDGVQPTE